MSATRSRDPDDADAAVRGAQDAIERAIHLGGLTGDPLAHVLQAQSKFLGAMHKLQADAPKPVTAEDVEGIVAAQADTLEQKVANAVQRAGYQVARRSFVDFDRRAAMLFAASIFAAIVLGGAAGAFLEDYFTAGVTWHVPAACGSSGGKVWCQPGVWLGTAQPPR